MINKGFGMLITAVLCFIDQRIASLLYHNFKDKLHIHKRCIAKFFCTTIVVICQILFDRDCALKNKSQIVDQTELTQIETTQPKSPSFNLHMNQKSTPKTTFALTPTNETFLRTPTAKTYKPTPTPRKFRTNNNNPDNTDTIEIEIHQNDTDNTYYTAQNSQM
jgi:hypothetical protein